MSKVPKKEIGNIFAKIVAALWGSSHVYYYILVSLHRHTRNFLPKDRNTIIKVHLYGEGLPSFFSLLQVDVFQQKQGILQQIILDVQQTSQKKLVSDLVIQIISPKILQESTTILQLKFYIVYVMRKLVGHPPWQECPINLALFLFPFACNGRSLDHHFLLFFPMKFHIIK